MKMQILRTLLVILGVALVATTQGDRAQVAAKSAVLTFMYGDVQVRHGARGWSEARLNETLGPGDAVKTGGDARAEITLGSGGYVRVDERSHLLITHLQEDGVTAFFRPDPTGPRHTIRAVRAAMMLRDRLLEVLEPEGLGFGITLTTGDITLGFVGKNTPEPQVLGDPVNVAFRLQQEARARGELIVADWSTATAVEQIRRMMRPLAEVQVRNRTEPVRIFAPADEPVQLDEDTPAQ